MASTQRVPVTIKHDWYHAKNLRDGKKAFHRALARYGFQVAAPGRHPRLLAVDAHGSQPGQVIAKPQPDDAEYLCPVEIGTPAKTFMLDFDTGSSDMWVMGKGEGRSNKHPIYDPSSSSTAKLMHGSTWHITYGDNSSAGGTVYQDTVNIGGIKILSQAVELATQVSTQFVQSNSDGLLGLAFASLNTIKPTAQATPVDNMIKQGEDPTKIFTSAFYSTRDDGSNPSFYTFGSIDKDLVGSNTISWANLVSKNQGFWMIKSEAYTVNGTKHAQEGNEAIFDTGTTLCLVSDDVADKLYQDLESKGLARFDDSQQGWLISASVTVEQLPKFSVDVEGHTLTIQPEDLIFAEAEEGWWFSGVQARGDIPFDIYGDTVLKSIYAIWDVGNKRFGFTPKIEKKQNLFGIRKN